MKRIQAIVIKILVMNGFEVCLGVPFFVRNQLILPFSDGRYINITNTHISEIRKYFRTYKVLFICYCRGA